MDFLVEMSAEVEGVIRKVLPELRIAVKRTWATYNLQKTYNTQKGQHITYKKNI